MKIAIDYNPAIRRRTGIGNNIFHLVENLQKIDGDNYYYLYFNTLSYLYSKIRNKGSKLKKMHNNFQYLPLITYKIYSYLIGNKIDIAHGTNYKISFSGSRGTITTIHDIAFLIFPDFVPDQLRPKYIKRTKEAIEKSDIVITVSNSSADDINKILNVPRCKIKVVYNGVDKSIFNERIDKKKFEIIKQKYNINRKYILYIGTIEKRKNISNLVKAFKSMNKEYLLILGGKVGWKGEEVLNIVQNLGLNNDVRIIGYIPDDELPPIYSGAELFVYPSLYEGFGIPPIESISCGTPVIVSDIPVFRETLDNVAIYINPENPDEIQEKTLYYLKNDEEREKLKKNGRKLSERYNWDKSARKLLDIYLEVYNS